MVVSLSLAFVLINGFLAFLGQKDIAVYYIASAIAFLVIALAFSGLSSRSRTAMQFLSALVFCGFLFFAAVKISQMIQ